MSYVLTAISILWAVIEIDLLMTRYLGVSAPEWPGPMVRRAIENLTYLTQGVLGGAMVMFLFTDWVPNYYWRADLLFLSFYISYRHRK